MSRPSRLGAVAAGSLAVALIGAASFALAAPPTCTAQLHGSMYAHQAVATARVAQVSAGDSRIHITAKGLPDPAMIHVKPQRHVAHRALAQGTGARGLRTITVPPGQLTTVPIAQLANPEILHLINPKSPRMTDVTGETRVYGEGSTTTPPLVSEGAAMRVVLADHQAGVRSALRLLLTHVLGLRVVGEVTVAVDLWTQVQDAGPDLLLLDWGLLGAGTGGALARLHAMYPDLQVIVLSGYPEARQHALAAGADAFVSKADSPEQMLKTLRVARARRGAGRATDDGAMAEGTDE